LLVIGQVEGVWVLGAPGCARSPKENGFDWVLARLLAGLAVTPDDIMGMGVGGLLMEIVSRPQPRETVHRTIPEGAGPVAALVLAAGRSSRTGGPNKLLATLDGKPLVRHVVEAALASAVSGVTVVTGHMADRIEAALTGLPVQFVHNPDYAAGLSTSLKVGIAALPESAAATLVLLADMPRVEAAAINSLVAAFDPDRGTHVVVPTFEGRRGNPVLWSRRFFEALAGIQGDVGARHLIGENAAVVTEVELGPAVALDLDTREALAAAGAVIVE
jgi:molybdenum cofactor cytidylyltransferase